MSDRTGRKPKGTMVRPAPDWFSDNIGIGGIYQILTGPPPGNHWWSISLFNNDDQGSVYRVYGISAFQEGGGGFLAQYFNGAAGTLIKPCANLRADLAPPSGQIFVEGPTTIAGQVNPFDVNDDVGLVPCAGFDSGYTIGRGPLFIIPVGWSLKLVNPSSSLQVAAFFYYQRAAN